MRPGGEALQARLREIAAAGPTPEEALEPSLRAILDAANAAAGAICFFDQRAEVLRLAAESGLSDEGCRRLRTVRRGDTLSWDMPLQSLFNRRAYLIESAAKNRYVPPLVAQAENVRTIACLPLYSGATPLGSLVVVTMAPQTFAERDIHFLELPLRELMRLIETVRQRPATSPPTASSSPPPVLPPRAPLASAIDGHAAPNGNGSPPGHGTLAAAETQADRDEELARVRAQLVDAEAEIAGLRERFARPVAATPSPDEIEELRGALSAAELRCATRDAELAAACERLTVAEAELATTRARLDEVVVAADTERSARTDAAERLATVEADAATAAAHWEQLLRDAGMRATAAEEAARARAAELVSARAEVADLTARLEDQIAECGCLRASLVERDAAPAAAVSETVALPPPPALPEPPALPAPPASASAGPGAPDETASVPEEAATPSDSVPPPDEPAAGEAASTSPLPPMAATDAAAVIVVVDADAAWESLAVDGGRRVVVCAPAALDGAPVGDTLLANLAAPGALDALARLRAAGRLDRIRACVADPGTGKAFLLGPIEPTARPLDPDAALAALARHVGRGGRLVTVGTDVDVLVSLRQALARQGVSVSMAWDAKQATDLFTMVRPQVVVLDLALPQREGYRLLAKLAIADPLPTVLLVPAADDGAGFTVLLDERLFGSRLVPLARALPPAPPPGS